MRRGMQVNVRSKPKPWSVGIFVAAGLWLLGEHLFNLGTNPVFLIGVVIMSFWVDTATTGKSTKDGVYID